MSDIVAEKHGFILKIKKIIHVLFSGLYNLAIKSARIIYIYQSIVNSNRNSSKLELNQNKNPI